MKKLKVFLVLSSCVFPFFAQADLVINFGNGLLTGATLNAGPASVSELSPFTSGSLGAGISFDLTVSPTNNTPSIVTIGTQGGGIGVSSGRAASGIDNNDSETFTESMIFSLSNVQGVPATHRLVFTSFGLSFANEGAEFFSIDNGAATQTAAAGVGGISFNSLDTPAEMFRITAVDGPAAGASDSRYAFDQVTVAIQAIPEPSAMALILIASPLLMLRRLRKA